MGMKKTVAAKEERAKGKKEKKITRKGEKKRKRARKRVELW